jgi:hypothetical protein
MTSPLPIAAALLLGCAPLAAAQVTPPAAPAPEPAAPTAELYAAFRYSYARANDGAETRWTAVNNASRVGVRGSVTDLGVTAFADLQLGVSIDAEPGGAALTQRHLLAGLRGAFGSLTAGRLTTAYKAAGVRVDPFYDTSTIHGSGAVPGTGLFIGATFGLSGLTNGWADRGLAYATPSLHGLTADAEVHLDPERDPDYGLGLGYRAHGVDAGVQYYDPAGGGAWAQTAGVESAVRGHAAYAREGAWSLGASYERLEAVATGEAQAFLYAAGTAAVAPRTTLAVSLGHVGDGAVQPVTGTGYQAGLFYALLPQAQLHALYSRLDADAAPTRSSLAVGFACQLLLRR